MLKQLFLLLSLFGMLSCGKHRSRSVEAGISVDTTVLRNGDLLFRKGLSNASRIITTLYPGSYSHVGILWNTRNGWYVIHASEDENKERKAVVTMEPLRLFTSRDKAEAVGVATVKCTAEKARRAALRAIDMARKKVPFDYEYNLKDPSKVYCSELVYLVYKSEGVNLLTHALSQKKPPLLTNYLFPEELWHNTLTQPLQAAR